MSNELKTRILKTGTGFKEFAVDNYKEAAKLMEEINATEVYTFYLECYNERGNGEHDCWCELDIEEITAFIEEEKLGYS